MRYPDELWWDQISSPLNLKKWTADTLMSGKTVWLSGHLPWPDTFLYQTKDLISQGNSQLALEYREMDSLEGTSPAELVFQLVPSAKSRYMPGQDLSEYIASTGILDTTILWLAGVDEARHGQWLALSSGLAKHNSGFRVVCQGNCGNKRYRNVELLQADTFSSEFERILFAMMLSGGMGYSTDIQMYCSYLAVELAGEQVEQLPILLRDTNQLICHPELCLEDAGLPRNEILQRSLHSVQLKVLQPKLEDRQEKLVDRLAAQLTRLLPFKDDFGNVCNDLYSIELRHLVYFHHQHAFRISDQEDQLLKQLHEMRNLIAHRKVVPGEDVFSLLNN